MRVIRYGMTKHNLISVTEIHYLFRTKCSSIASDDFPRIAKSRQDMVFKEFYDNRVSGIPRRDGFYPFGEIISGCGYPSMLGRSGRMDFSNEV